MSLFLSAGISDCGGSTLLDEVLAHFTDISPAELRRSNRREMPEIIAWSAPACIQRKRGQRGQGMMRTYEMQAADRGQDNCYGRPGPSPSPSPSPVLSQTPSPIIWSNGSDQGGSRAGSRADSRTPTPMSRVATPMSLPKSAQQFPVLVASTWASSRTNRPASQQSQHRDTPAKKVAAASHDGEDKPQWKHHAKPGLFGRHWGNEEADHGDTSEGHVGRRGSAERSDSRTKRIFGDAMNPESNILPKPSQKRRESRVESPSDSPTSARRRATLVVAGTSRSGLASARNSLDRSASLRAKYFSSDSLSGLAKMTDDSLKDSALDIWSINLPSSKYDRMQRLQKHRRLKSSHVKTGDRDKVLSSEDLDRAEQAVQKWFGARSFGSKKQFCRKNMVNALSDFGIRACNGEEKDVLADIFEEHASVHIVTVKDFCDIAEQARVRLRSSRFCAFSRAWQQIDTDDVGSLPHAQVLQLLAEFKLAPQTPDDVDALEACMEELHKDTSSSYPLFEVEHLVQRCRERAESQRRALEHQIRKQYFMFRSAWSDSNDHLIAFHDAFTHFDVSVSGRLGSDEVLYLLGEFGICTLRTSEQRKKMETDIRNFLDSQTDEGEETSLTFPWFLLFVKTLRELRNEMQHQLVAPIFSRHDKYKKGELGMKEVCDIIEELELQPQTPEEQESVGKLLEDIDEYGTALFTLEQVVLAISRIIEQRAQQLRCAENTKAASLNVSRRLKFELRRAFETLDVDGKRTLTFPQIIKAVEMMEWRIADAKIREVLDEVDEDGSETIDFMEFMELMSKVDREIKAAEKHERSMSDDGLEPLRSSALLEEAASGAPPHAEVGGNQGATGDKMPKSPNGRRGVKPLASPKSPNHATRFKRSSAPIDRPSSKQEDSRIGRTRYHKGKTVVFQSAPYP